MQSACGAGGHAADTWGLVLLVEGVVSVSGAGSASWHMAVRWDRCRPGAVAAGQEVSVVTSARWPCGPLGAGIWGIGAHRKGSLGAAAGAGWGEVCHLKGIRSKCKNTGQSNGEGVGRPPGRGSASAGARPPPAGKTSGPVPPSPAEAPPSPGARVGCAAAGRCPRQRLPFGDGACEICLLERESWSLQTPDPGVLKALEPRAAGEVSESARPLPGACVLRRRTWAAGSVGGQWAPR